MHIAAGADDRFAMPMAVTLYSALANLEHGTDVSLYVLDGGISRENKRRLAEVLNVDHVELTLEWLNPDLSALCGLKTTHAFSQATYLRLLIPELLPGDVDRVIYLDSDLVVERDLSELWQSEMDGRSTLAVKDYRYPYVSCVDWAGETYTAVSCAPDAPYCNSGVLVMDLEAWRTRQIAQRAVAYMQQFPQFVRWADQDGINAVLAGDWGVLDDKWNVMLHGLSFYGGFAGLSELERRHLQQELQRGAFILHFSGPDKPWRLRNRSRSPARFSDYRFFDYLQRSNWFGCVHDINTLMEETWREDDEWIKALTRSAQALEDVIPEGDSFILVDEATWPAGILDNRSAIPFLEANGRYAGIPPDDVTAIRDFERLRAAGARYIVFVEPALWWLEYFGDFRRHLSDSCQCLVSNDHMVAFRVD